MTAKIRLTKLTDTQLILLSEASRESQGRVKVPNHIRGGAIHRVLARLIADRLIESDDRPGDDQRRPFTGEDGATETYRITAAGLSAIGLNGCEAPCEKSTGSETPAQSDLAAPYADKVGSAVSVTGKDNSCAALPAKPNSNKIVAVIAMLNADAGASLADLKAATGWQPHTIRAAVSRLRQAGRTIVTTRGGDRGTAYRIVLQGENTRPVKGERAGASASHSEA